MIKQRTEREYRNIELDSYSSIKLFAENRLKYFKKFVEKTKIEDEELSNATITGMIVDCLLLDKNSFDSKFHLSALQKQPSGLMLNFVEELNKLTSKYLEQDKKFEEIALEAYKLSGFKLKFDTVIEKFVGSDAEIYYRELREVSSKNLVVVSLDQIQNAEKIVELLKTNETTKNIVNLVNSDRYLVQNQLQIEGFEIDGLPLKGMIDKCIIDHKEKTISPYDLKVVWSVENFREEYFLKRLAYIQAYLYKEACLYLKGELELEYYHVNNLQFIVADSIGMYDPLIYTLDSDDTDDAYNGFEYRGRKYPGVKSIIDELKWAKSENQWRISKKNSLNRGILNIKS